MSTNTADTYLALITSEHRSQPKFGAMITADVSPQVQVQALLASMVPLFDLDNPPVGNQLDIIGQWVGVSRNLLIPIANVFFEWDGTDAQGWDFGIWNSDVNPSVITVLPDDVYLILIRAKIAANHWDGTTEGAYKIWSILFPTLNLLIQDNQDMSYALAVQGAPLDSLTLALLTQGILPLRPEGVLITEYITPVDTQPLFGWDIESDFVKGWDESSWGIETAST